VVTGRHIMLTAFSLAWCAVVIIYAVTHQGVVPAEIWALYGTGVGTIYTLTKNETSNPYAGRHRKDKT
jgi:hypothetical protein